MGAVPRRVGIDDAVVSLWKRQGFISSLAAQGGPDLAGGVGIILSVNYGGGSIPANTWTRLDGLGVHSFYMPNVGAADVFDSGGFFDSGAPDRFTFPVNGIYLVSAEFLIENTQTSVDFAITMKAEAWYPAFENAAGLNQDFAFADTHNHGSGSARPIDGVPGLNLIQPFIFTEDPTDGFQQAGIVVKHNRTGGLSLNGAGLRIAVMLLAGIA